LLKDATAGDPMTGLLWTHRSTRKLAKALRKSGIKVSARTIARLLPDASFSLRTNRKERAEVTDSDRDRPFRYLSRLRGAGSARRRQASRARRDSGVACGISRTGAALR
jgi:hypothetical protein